MKNTICFLSPARSALFKGPCSESSPAETMNSDEYHDHPALGQLVTGTVGNHNFQYWVARNPKNKMNFARDYVEIYERQGKQKNKPRSTQNFHGYFITPDGESCIIVDENNLSEFRTPQTPKEIENANRLLAKYKKKYPGTTPEIHLREKENKIANGEWKRGNRRGQQRQGPPPGSFPLFENKKMQPPPPAPGFTLPTTVFAPLPTQSAPIPNTLVPNQPSNSLPFQLPVQVIPPQQSTLPSLMPTQPFPPSLPTATATWGPMNGAPQYTTVNTPGNGNPIIIPVSPMLPLMPRGNYQPIPVTAAHSGTPRPSHPAHSDTTTFYDISYPTDFFKNFVEKNPIFSICRTQLNRLNQALNTRPTDYFRSAFQKLAEFIGKLLVEYQENSQRFDKMRIGTLNVRVQPRLEAFFVVYHVHMNSNHKVIDEAKQDLDRISTKEFREYYIALKKVFEIENFIWTSMTDQQKTSILKRVFLGLQHGIGHTLLKLHDAAEEHKNKMSAVQSLNTTLVAAGFPPAPMGHTSRASEEVSDHLQELVNEVSRTIQHNQDIHAPSSKTARVEYYKSLLHSKRDSLSEDHSPAACLLALAYDKEVNLEYFSHCVDKFSDEFMQAVKQTFTRQKNDGEHYRFV